MSSSNIGAEDPIHDEQAERRAAFALELESLPAGELSPLVTYTRHRRRLWMVAIPGLGLLYLP